MVSSVPRSLLALLVAALLGATPRPLPAQAGPPLPIVKNGACLFVCCRYGWWRSPSDSIVVRREPFDTQRVAFVLRRNERFQALTGRVYLLEGGPVVVRQPVAVRTGRGGMQRTRFEPGATLLVFDHVGIGAYRAWAHGRMMEVDAFWDYPNARVDTTRTKAHMLRFPRIEWWVRVRHPSGHSGWIHVPEGVKFGGFDRCD